MTNCHQLISNSSKNRNRPDAPTPERKIIPEYDITLTNKLYHLPGIFCKYRAFLCPKTKEQEELS
nr:MAG TPA: hypothetical protein [Caudoviricetes sp.]